MLWRSLGPFDSDSVLRLRTVADTQLLSGILDCGDGNHEGSVNGTVSFSLMFSVEG